MRISSDLELLDVYFMYDKDDKGYVIPTIHASFENKKACVICKDYFKIQELTFDFGSLLSFPEVPDSINNKYDSFGFKDFMKLKNEIVSFRKSRLSMDYDTFMAMKGAPVSVSECLDKIKLTEVSLIEELSILKDLTKEDFKTLFLKLVAELKIIRDCSNIY